MNDVHPRSRAQRGFTIQFVVPSGVGLNFPPRGLEGFSEEWWWRGNKRGRRKLR